MHKLTEMREADLLLILGTSLTVQPFASLADLVPPGCPRVLFNREEAGDIGERSDDVLALGDCDAGVRELSRMLGWEEELDAEWATTALPGDEDELKAPVPKGEEAAKDHVEQLAAEIATSLKIDDAHDTEAKVSAVGLPADSGTAPEKPVASRSPSAPEEADVSKTKVTHEPKL
jgi:NAD-dependent histone deacetylase SIR2